MPAAHHHDRRPWCHLVEIAPQREPLLFQLRLVPVAVRHNNVARLRLLDARGHRAQHVADRSRPRKVDTGTAPRAMQVVVGEARDDGEPFEVDLPSERGWRASARPGSTRRRRTCRP